MAHPFQITPPVTGEMAEELLNEVHTTTAPETVEAQLKSAKDFLASTMVHELEVRDDTPRAGRSASQDSQHPLAALSKQ